MKLNETRPYLESSGEIQEKLFSIEDQGMIFDILRNKMYSNPILAICREISCNARDAHREVGADYAVHISLPNNLDPTYKIEDFGPGISPDRMSNIFIKYTASTKRSDNVQTGGFGLGAKTPFSYSDTFSINTCHNGIKYTYVCVIDETRVGKMMLVNQEATKQKNGTEIAIPVSPKDFNDFRINTERACRHWEVKPFIKGGSIQWQTMVPIIEGDRWAIVRNENREGFARAIIDGIEYPLDLAALRTYADAKLIDAAQGQFVMYFGIGELSLSASREAIYLDERTKGIIRERLELIRKEIVKRTEEKVEKLPTLWAACCYYNNELPQAFNNIDFLGKIMWKGQALVKSHIYPNVPTHTFVKGKWSRKFGTDPDKLSRSTSSYIYFEDNVDLYFNDLTIKEPTPRHVKKAFEDDKTLNKVHVITATDAASQDYLFKTFNLEAMGIKLLSSITKATGRAYTPAAQRVLVFKFDAAASAFRQVSYASLDEDTSDKVLCELSKDHYNSRTAQLPKGQLDWNVMRTLVSKFPNTSFYGVDKGTPKDRIAADFADFTPITSFVKEKLIDNKGIDFLQIKYANRHSNLVDDRFLRVSELIKKLIVAQDSVYFQRQIAHERVREIAKSDSSLLDIYEMINGNIDESQFKVYCAAHPELDIERINKTFNKKYPLLKHIQSYNYQDMVGDLANYINLIDKENANV